MSVVRSDVGIEKIYRFFSRSFVKKIINTKITPNIISWLSFLVFVISIPFIVLANNGYINFISFSSYKYLSYLIVRMEILQPKKILKLHLVDILTVLWIDLQTISLY